MRALIILLFAAGALCAQEFDVVQLRVQHGDPGEAAVVEVIAGGRLRASKDDGSESGWRSHLVAQSGSLSGIRNLKVINTGASYQVQAHLRTRRRGFRTQMPIDARSVVIVRNARYSDEAWLEEPLCIWMAREGTGFSLPTPDQLVQQLLEPLLAEPPRRSGLAGQLLEHVRGIIPQRDALNEEVVAMLVGWSLGRMLPPASLLALLNALQSDATRLTPKSRRQLRLACGDFTALDAPVEDADAPELPDRIPDEVVIGAHAVVQGRFSHDWWDSTALLAGWAGSDDPEVRGQFAWAFYSGRNFSRSMASGAVAMLLHDEVIAGRMVLPGTPTEQAERRAKLDQLAREADPTDAVMIFSVGALLLLGVLLLLRRFSLTALV